MYEVMGLNTIGLWTGWGANFDKDEEIPENTTYAGGTFAGHKDGWKLPEEIYARKRHGDV